MSDPTSTEELVAVRLYGFPLALRAEAEEHVEGLLREFLLITAGEESGVEAHVPRQLLELIDELNRDYSAMTGPQESQIGEAKKSGIGTIDLVYRVPREVAEACLRLEEAMDAADRYCREGTYLLSLATPPRALAFRRWYLSEFVRQIRGHPPEPWPEWVARHSETSEA